MPGKNGPKGKLRRLDGQSAAAAHAPISGERQKKRLGQSAAGKAERATTETETAAAEMTSGVKKGKNEKTFDEFLATWSDSDSSAEGEEARGGTEGLNAGGEPVAAAMSRPISDERGDDTGGSPPISDDSSADEEGPGSIEEDALKQKKYLEGLAEKDPEFYKFLQDQDQSLLNFSSGGSSSDDDDDGHSRADRPKRNGGERRQRTSGAAPDAHERRQRTSGAAPEVHVPPDALEVASDESDYEADAEASADAGKSTKVSHALVESWATRLQSKTVGLSDVADVIEAFGAAVATVAGAERSAPAEAAADAAAAGKGGDRTKKDKNRKKTDADEDEEDGAAGADKQHRFRVVGGPMFNAIVRLCVTELELAIRRVLRVPNDAKDYHKLLSKSKMWKRMHRLLKMYTLDLVRLLSGATDAKATGVLLKHAHAMTPFYAVLPKSAKTLLRTLLSLWSASSDETVRVAAFLCVARLVRCSDNAFLELVIKQMYISYVKNVKFTSPSTWPAINFMRRSLAELLAIDQGLTYYYAFIYIRQLAIHLRNAITLKKKDSTQAVYNWQFVHSLHLWTHLIGATHPSTKLQPLIYPLVQVINGAIKLVYTPKYYPLRFHLCSMLTKITAETETFIPVLPFYLDVLNSYDFNKRLAKASLKPFDFSCILKLSKSQLAEQGFKDVSIDQVFSGLLTHLSVQSYRIAFPDLVTPMLFQLRDFLKKCRVANYGKKIKQIVDKVNENAKFIDDRRRKVPFGLADKPAIRAWEAGVRAEPPPLAKFFAAWKKVHDLETSKKRAEKIDVEDGDFKLVPKMKKSKPKSAEDFKGIFGGSDEDSDDGDDERFQPKEERGKKSKKKHPPSDSDDESDDDDKPSPPKKPVPSKAMHSRETSTLAERGLPSSDDDDDDDQGDLVEDLNAADLESEAEDDSESEAEDDSEAEQESEDEEKDSDGGDKDADDDGDEKDADDDGGSGSDDDADDGGEEESGEDDD